MIGCWLPPRGGSLERVTLSRGRLSREGVQPLMRYSLHLISIIIERLFSEYLFGLLAARAVGPMLVLFERNLPGGQRCPHVALAAPKSSSERAVFLTRCKSFLAIL